MTAWPTGSDWGTTKQFHILADTHLHTLTCTLCRLAHFADLHSCLAACLLSCLSGCLPACLHRERKTQTNRHKHRGRHSKNTQMRQPAKNGNAKKKKFRGATDLGTWASRLIKGLLRHPIIAPAGPPKLDFFRQKWPKTQHLA